MSVVRLQELGHAEEGLLVEDPLRVRPNLEELLAQQFELPDGDGHRHPLGLRRAFAGPRRTPSVSCNMSSLIFPVPVARVTCVESSPYDPRRACSRG